MKAAVTPVLIGSASWAGRRWGDAVGGWFVGLPLTSGPVVLFVSMEHGAAFGAATAAGVLAGCLSQTAFTLAYGSCLCAAGRHYHVRPAAPPPRAAAAQLAARLGYPSPDGTRVGFGARSHRGRSCHWAAAERPAGALPSLRGGALGFRAARRVGMRRATCCGDSSSDFLVLRALRDRRAGAPRARTCLALVLATAVALAIQGIALVSLRVTLSSRRERSLPTARRSVQVSRLLDYGQPGRTSGGLARPESAAVATALAPARV